MKEKLQLSRVSHLRDSPIFSENLKKYIYKLGTFAHTKTAQNKFTYFRKCLYYRKKTENNSLKSTYMRLKLSNVYYFVRNRR